MAIGTSLVTRYRRGAKSTPEVYLPLLAKVLATYSAFLGRSHLMRRESVSFLEEAIGIERFLSDQNPNIHLKILSEYIAEHERAEAFWTLEDSRRFDDCTMCGPFR